MSPKNQITSTLIEIVALAGSAESVSDTRQGLREEGIVRAVAARNTPALFEWLVGMATFQGISDAVAASYLDRHGVPRWRDLEQAVAAKPRCPKLASHWGFEACGYVRTEHTCAEPRWVQGCPVPTIPLRNGRLQQLALGLFLFLRDVADADLVGWVDHRLATTAREQGSIRWAHEALVTPMRAVHGLSDKVVAMTLSGLLIGAGSSRPLWAEAGSSLIVIDTLVHNLLHRTGALRHLGRRHAYGTACYRPGGCAEIVEGLARRIDARTFDPSFPKFFPRFVQHALWRYCAEGGLAVCNGNTINDRKRCANTECSVWRHCERVRLR